MYEFWCSLTPIVFWGKNQNVRFREKIREMTDESRKCNIWITGGEKEVNGSETIIIPSKEK